MTIPHMSDDELRTFVDHMLANRIFTSAHLKPSEDLTTVFMGLALGALKDLPQDQWEEIGVLYEYMDKAGPWAINGLPTFMTFRIMHKDDWTRAKEAITREQERRKTIPI